jgi:hypothetical protein
MYSSVLPSGTDADDIGFNLLIIVVFFKLMCQSQLIVSSLLLLKNENFKEIDTDNEKEIHSFYSINCLNELSSYKDTILRKN